MSNDSESMSLLSKASEFLASRYDDDFKNNLAEDIDSENFDYRWVQANLIFQIQWNKNVCSALERDCLIKMKEEGWIFVKSKVPLSYGYISLHPVFGILFKRPKKGDRIKI